MLPPGLAPPPGMPGPGGHPDPAKVALMLRLMHGGAAGPGGPPPGAGAGPPGPPEPAENGKGLSPLEAVQSVIEDIHQLMKIVPDPQAVSVVATCLKAMTALQAQMMQQSKGGQ